MYAKFIQGLRKKHSFTQEELANGLSISRPTYIQIEQGLRDLTLQEAQRLAGLFHLSFEDFLQQKDHEVSIEEQEACPAIKTEERLSIPQESYEKFKQVFLYVLKKVGGKPNVGMTVLYKILYFIDFDYYEKYEEQLLGLRYVKNHFGPTPNKLFPKLIKELEQDNSIQVVKTKFYHPQTKYLLNPDLDPDLTIINGQEKEHIDWELQRLADLTANQLTYLSHQDVPWISAQEGQELDYEAVFYRTPETSIRDYGDEAKLSTGVTSPLRGRGRHAKLGG